MSFSMGFTQAIGIMITIGGNTYIKDMEWMSASAISETLGIPRPTVVNLLGRLMASGLLESREGKQGGVRLAKDPHKITLADIFSSIEREKPLFRLDSRIRTDNDAARAAQKKVLARFSKIEKQMRSGLDEVILFDLFGCE